jgi:hypothetical protein
MVRYVRASLNISGLGSDMSVHQKLTISKLDSIEPREIMGTTRSNLNSRVQI